MTRKDYQLIASVISRLPDDGTRETAAIMFAKELQNENKRFKGEYFFRACLLPEYQIKLRS
jgi:hypothetical protein|tara:strand:- start:236 stop:418 length:183 start_codon:yes stop_codon:yes gene_type:complete